ALNRMLIKISYEILQKEEYKPVKQPNYNITKLDPEDGIEFTFSFTNYPQVKLGDFSKINIKKEEPKVTTEDIDSVIKSIIRSSVKPERIKELTTVTEKKSEDTKVKSKTTAKK